MVRLATKKNAKNSRPFERAERSQRIQSPRDMRSRTHGSREPFKKTSKDFKIVTNSRSLSRPSSGSRLVTYEDEFSGVSESVKKRAKWKFYNELEDLKQQLNYEESETKVYKTKITGLQVS